MGRNTNHSFRGQTLLYSGIIEEGERVILTTPDVMTDTDYMVASDLTAPGAVAIELPSGTGVGDVVIIRDKKGDAAANNITITPPAGETIDGGASVVINVNRGCLTIRKDSDTTWCVRSRSFASGGAMAAHAATHAVGGGDSLYDADLTFLREVNHNITVAASTTVSTAGGALNDQAGAGSAGTVAAAGAAGGARLVRGGTGGAGSAAQVSGPGGALSLRAGNAGADGGGGGNNGGAVDLDAGAATGAGTAGAMTIGASVASAITIGRSSIDVTLGSRIVLAANKGILYGAGTGGFDGNLGTGAFRFGAASATAGFFGVTAVAQPSSVGQTAGFTAGAGAAVLDDSTFTGGSGTKAYTIGDLVKHFKALGLLAAS